MKDLFILIAHLFVTIAKLSRRGGLRAAAAESLAVKQQLLVMKRRQQRAPKLTPRERLVLGVCSLFVSAKRRAKMAVILKTSTLLCFHQALVRRKYHLLYSPKKRRRPGPKGPAREIIALVLDLKRHNPRFGSLKIAQTISHAFGIDINRDMVRRILAKHYHPDPCHTGPSWLSILPQTKDTLWSIDLFKRESIRLHTFRVLVVIDVFTRRFIGFAVAPGDPDGPTVCRMLNHATAGKTPPKYLSSDHDPLFRFHRWLAN